VRNRRRPLADKVEALLAAGGLSNDAIAQQVGCDPTYVGHLRRRRDGKPADSRHRGARTDDALINKPMTDSEALSAHEEFEDRAARACAHHLADLEARHPPGHGERPVAPRQGVLRHISGDFHSGCGSPAAAAAEG
jgi:hypothetical protein